MNYGVRRIKALPMVFFSWLIIALFLVTAADSSDVLLGVPNKPQVHDQWCWAGASQALLEYYGTVAAQCDIANWARGRSDCCGNTTFSWSHPCNQPNYICCTTGSTQDILAQWDVNSNILSSALTQAACVTEINAGRPFVMQFNWTAGLGHQLVGSGYELNGQYIWYMDPWPGKGDILKPYSWVVSSTDHTWAYTLTTNPKPTVTTGAASSISMSGAVLNGTVNPYGISTTVTFEYGTTTSYGSIATADQSPVASGSATAVSKAITGLTPNMLYHFRVKAANTAGTSYSSDTTFTAIDSDYQWTAPAYGADWEAANSIAVGRLTDTVNKDYIYVAGTTVDSNNIPNVLVGVYNNTGGLVKTYRYNLGGAATAIDVVMDSNNNIYVGGYYNNPTTNMYEFFILKYNPSSTSTTPLWVRKLSLSGTDLCTSCLKIDNSNNLYISGAVGTGAAGGVYTAKYTSGGTLVWKFAYNPSSGDSLTGMVVDSSGNLYFAGYKITESRFYVSKFTTPTSKAWETTEIVTLPPARIIYYTVFGMTFSYSVYDYSVIPTIGTDGSLIVIKDIKGTSEMLRYDTSGGVVLLRSPLGSAGESVDIQNVLESGNTVYALGWVNYAANIFKIDRNGTTLNRKSLVYPTSPVYALGYSKFDATPKIYIHGLFQGSSFSVQQYLAP